MTPPDNCNTGSWLAKVSGGCGLTDQRLPTGEPPGFLGGFLDFEAHRLPPGGCEFAAPLAGLSAAGRLNCAANFRWLSEMVWSRSTLCSNILAGLPALFLRDEAGLLTVACGIHLGVPLVNTWDVSATKVCNKVSCKLIGANEQQ